MTENTECKAITTLVYELWRDLLHLHNLDVRNTMDIKLSMFDPLAVILPNGATLRNTGSMQHEDCSFWLDGCIFYLQKKIVNGQHSVVVAQVLLLDYATQWASEFMVVKPKGKCTKSGKIQWSTAVSRGKQRVNAPDRQGAGQAREGSR